VRGYRLRDLLVPLELALAVILLVTTGLFLRFAWEQEHLPRGFEDQHLYALEVAPRTAERGPSNPASLNLSLLEQVRQVPGIEAAAVADGLPGAGVGRGTRMVTLDETSGVRSAGQLAVDPIDVSPGFFATMGIPLARGRDFSPADGFGSAPVAIISAHLARRWWPDRDPIGRTFRLGGSGAPDRDVTVVGVAGDVMTSDTLQSPYVYLPLGLTPSPRVLVVARVLREPPDPAALEQAVARVPPLRLDEVWSVRARLADQFRGADFALWFFGGFAGLALLLAAIGVYTVVSQAVVRRRREIGIRVALGASRRDVIRAVVGPTLTLSGVGIAVGVTGTLLVTRITFSLLLNVSATSPVVWAAIVGVLALAAVLACAAPVRRAVSVDPAVVLRQN
jgi:predicted permease